MTARRLVLAVVAGLVACGCVGVAYAQEVAAPATSGTVPIPVEWLVPIGTLVAGIIGGGLAGRKTGLGRDEEPVGEQVARILEERETARDQQRQHDQLLSRLDRLEAQVGAMQQAWEAGLSELVADLRGQQGGPNG